MEVERMVKFLTREAAWAAALHEEAAYARPSSVAVHARG